MKPLESSASSACAANARRRVRSSSLALAALCLSQSVGHAHAAKPPGSITLVAVGDICLAHNVERIMAARGRGYPFAALKPSLRSADIVFGNLECCLATSGQPVPKRYNFRGHPRGALALAESGFDVVSLANNHALDYGKPALAETLEHLRQAGVVAVGAGRTLAEARALRIVKVRGVRVGFLAYLGLFPSILPLRADEPAIDMADLPRLRHEVAAARRKVDLLVVSMHSGVEQSRTPSPRQRAIAHAAIDAGADLVIGHHPHVVQPVERYRGKIIAYSLGNFVFDPSASSIRDGGRGWSAMLMATLQPAKPPRVRLADLRIVDRQPRFAADVRRLDAPGPDHSRRPRTSNSMHISGPSRIFR